MDTEKEQQAPFYIAVHVYESTSEASDDSPLYEERFSLIVAASQEEAESKAAQLVDEPYSYKNVYGETITWSLKNTVVVQQAPYEEVPHGTELFYRFFRNYEAYHLAFLNVAAEEAAIENPLDEEQPMDN